MTQNEITNGRAATLLEHYLEHRDFQAVVGLLNTPGIDWRIVAVALAGTAAGVSIEEWQRESEVATLNENWAVTP